MKSFLLLIITVFMFACKHSLTDKNNIREMYMAGDQRVITSFANWKLQTMSVLYGNGAAKAYALSGYKTHYQGEVFTLVVYQQADNKYWYGSYINGAVKSVETVSALATKADCLTYRLQQGQAPTDSLGRPVAAAGRISYILSHQPSVFP